ncbi:hypothetical protein ACFFHW_00055 [Kushneria aurantia]|uniref:Uncharacterized protein n=2 Tax=Kushneria aurantia TaxID=504092 RepID=A0ABV6FYD4_9GAMM
MGLRDLFKRVLRSGKEEDLRSEPVEAMEDYESGRSRNSELTPEGHESEEKFHEEELQSMETLLDDTWIYKKGVAEPHHSEVPRTALPEQKPDMGEAVSDIDETFGLPAAVGEILAPGERAERLVPPHDHEVEKDFYEEEQRWFETLHDEAWIYEEIDTPTGRSIPDPRKPPPSSGKVSGLALGEPPSRSDRGGLGRRRQRLSLKTSRARSSPHRSARIGHKVFLSNKDAETGHCLPPRTTQDPSGDTGDATLPVEEVDAQIKQDTSSSVGEAGFITTESALITLRTDSDSQPAHQDASTSVMRDENAAEASCSDEASAAAWGQAHLPVPSDENPEPSMTSDLEEGEGGLVVSENKRNASLGPVTAEQFSVATQFLSETGRIQKSNLQQEDAEEEYGQEPPDYLYDNQDDYGLTALFDDEVYGHELLGDFALGAESLEELEGFTEDEGHEFDDDLTDQELLDEILPNEGEDQGKTERISQYLRACQRAAEFIRKNHWDDGYLHALAEVLNTRGYGAILTYLQRHADDGMVPEEFQLAIQLKAFWSQNRMLWIAFYRNGDSDSTYRVLSWAQCLRIIGMLGTSMGGIPQIEEVEKFIEDLFDEWYGDDGLRKYFKSFSKYLNYVTYRADSEIPVYMQLKWEPDGLEHEDMPSWAPMDPMHENLRRQLMCFGIASIMDYPQEAKTWFDLRYRDPNFNPEIKSKSADEKRKNRKASNKKSSKEKAKSPSRSSERLNREKSDAEESLCLEPSNAGALSRSAEEVVSSLQELFLKGYSKEEAAQILGLNQIEISNYLLVMK